MPSYPTEAEVRRALMRRANEYIRATGLAISTVSKHALNDSNYLMKVRDGGNFSIRNYARLMDFFDTNMPAQEKPRPRRRANGKRR